MFLVLGMSNQDELDRIDKLIAQHSVNEICPEGQPADHRDRSKHFKYGEDTGKKGMSGGVVPTGYRCHRCGEATHFIADCPYEEGNKHHKIRQARGVPKSFLETVGEGTAGAFLSADGELVRMKVVNKEERLRITGKDSVDLSVRRYFGLSYSRVMEELVCPLCREFFNFPISITKCCGENYCKSCLTSHLDKTFTSADGSIAPRECPGCSKTGLLSSDYTTDKNFENLLQSVLGVSATAVTTSGTRGVYMRSQSSSRGGVVKKQRAEKINLEIENEIKIDNITKNTKFKNLISVRGGRQNPFFSESAKRLTEEEFEEWKNRFRESLEIVGQFEYFSKKFKKE
jgi:hypothetical protein